MFKKAVMTVFASLLIIAGIGIARADAITVSVNPGGLGDGLIYGYYNARSALTFFRIVNTSTTDAVKARVRFREAKTSAEILDFNICLSNKDQWSAWIMANPSGTGAGIYPVDGGLNGTGDTITAPSISNMAISASGVITGGQAFKCGSGTGCSVTGLASLKNVTADDTMEGYWEVIGETVKTGGTDTEDSKVNFSQSQCLNPQDGTNGTLDFGDVPNVLGGDATVVVLRPTVSGSFSYNATALANCDLQKDYAVANEVPTWADCNDGLAGVDYALTKQNLIAMFNLEDWDKAQTETIVNFPTKSLHGTAGDRTKPFTDVDDNDCVPITLNIYNDLQDTTTTSVDFSPYSGPQGATLCNEVNVINMNNGSTMASDIMDSNVTKNLDVSAAAPFTGLGWVRIGLNTGTPDCSTGSSTCVDDNTYESFGLPSVGYVLTDLGYTFGQMNPTQYTVNASYIGD